MTFYREPSKLPAGYWGWFVRNVTGTIWIVHRPELVRLPMYNMWEYLFAGFERWEG